MTRLWFMKMFFALMCLGSAFGIATLAHTPSKYQLNSYNENDDEFLSQKEIVLEKSYHGLIRENETLVEITPLIKVDEEKICNFRIIKKPYHEIPFQIELVNNIGILKARHALNCEKRKNYHFEIMAIFCDGTHSTAANVHITIIDINEYSPLFLQPSYVTEVDEGRLYQEIIRVEATDKDCTPLFGDVCKYEILNNDQPFTIDNEGSIKNTEPLSHKISHNHILSVVAYDCAMKMSTPVMVNIKVRRACETKFIGIPERIDFTTSISKTLPLFPNGQLELCDTYCNDQNPIIRTSISLKTKHISFGCDREISNCSSGQPKIDLLPKGTDWTKPLNYDEGPESVFHFDGSSGVVVPNTVVTQQDFAIKPFSIITVFRHVDASKNNRHLKEHIVCSADNHKMNRHHMALFVRNCRLILLLRKNFNEGDLNIFSPAEWRWKLPQVCDNEWHHYVVSVSQTAKVELFIDGVQFESSNEDRHSNPEIIDDWPLHAAHGVNTTLSVGACFQSSENRLKHGFTGDISEIKLSINNFLTATDIRCGVNCAEHLLPPPESLLEADSQVQTNKQLNEIYIEGQNKYNIEKLVQKIQYINTKESPTIGRRNIELRTTLMCINQTAIRLPIVDTYIMVNEPSPLIILSSSNGDLKEGNTNSIQSEFFLPSSARITKVINKNESISLNLGKMDGDTTKLSIRGNSNKLVSYSEIKHGVHILENVEITMYMVNKKVESKKFLDSCSLIVFPSLNPDHEEIQVDGDESLSLTLDIKTNINKDGVEMIGRDTIENYLAVLKALVYSNKKPAYYLNRVFKLSCYQQNSQFKSAEFTLTLTVLHPKQSLINTSTKMVPDNSQQIIGSQTVLRNAVNEKNLVSHSLMTSHDTEEPSSRVRNITKRGESLQPIILIVLIVVFLVVILSGIFVARLKHNNNPKCNDQHHPCPKLSDDSLIWDDSALTITINPMQTDTVSEDSSDSEISESEDDEVVKGKFANLNQLEWDNSNIFTSTKHYTHH